MEVPDSHEAIANLSTGNDIVRRKTMRRLLFAVPLGIAATLLVAPPAFATSPHFITANASLSGTNLVVSFKEAGLGANQMINYTASANATTTVVCVNGGGKNPSASNKTSVQGPVSASGAFNSGKNGNITASLTLNPLPAPANFCPSGQKEQVSEVSFTNVSITDTTNNITASIAGTFDTGCLLPDVRGAC
jgi:hypothetical protein